MPDAAATRFDDHATDRRARPIAIALIGAGIGALAAAFASQYLFGIEPCVLCLWQRVPWAVVALGALAGLVFRVRAGLVLAFAALVFAAGAVLAGYHVGVQEHWWASVAGCGGGPVSGLTLEDLGAALAKPVKRCDEVDWRWLGLSLAGWNTVASTLLTAACAAGAALLPRSTSR